jgi:hypothetical protein
MTITINASNLRRQLRCRGWSARHAAFVSLNGGQIHVVHCRRGDQSFAVSSNTRIDAWKSADHLCQQLHSKRSDSPAIVQFPGLRKLGRRAG